MKPLAAGGLALALIGGLVALIGGGLRPLGGALLICGLALLVYAYFTPGTPAPGRPVAWTDDEPASGPAEIYRAEPGEVRPRPNTPGQAPGFTSPTPGEIPPVRQQASGGSTQYTTGHADVPPPRERQPGSAEYYPPAGEVRPAAAPEPPAPPAEHPGG